MRKRLHFSSFGYPYFADTHFALKESWILSDSYVHLSKRQKNKNRVDFPIATSTIPRRLKMEILKEYNHEQFFGSLDILYYLCIALKPSRAVSTTK